MYRFNNDYSECAHPRILKALLSGSEEQYSGYGADEITEEAKRLIKEKLKNQEVDIHFLSGGTLTNLTFISH